MCKFYDKTSKTKIRISNSHIYICAKYIHCVQNCVASTNSSLRLTSDYNLFHDLFWSSTNTKQESQIKAPIDIIANYTELEIFPGRTFHIPKHSLWVNEAGHCCDVFFYRLMVCYGGLSRKIREKVKVEVEC